MSETHLMGERGLRDSIASFGACLYNRGLAHSTAGNISVRLENGYLVTPTNSSLGRLDPAVIAKLSLDGRQLAGSPVSKEWALHQAVYAERPFCRAIVHLHSTYAVAVSCLQQVDPTNALQPFTPYCRMKIGQLPLLPYYAPGDVAILEGVREVARRHHALLLANHGPVVAAESLASAVEIMEELEESAKLQILLRGHDAHRLSAEQLRELDRRYPPGR